jgi:hypothetical protein
MNTTNKTDIIQVDCGRTWQTHAEILNEVFHKKTKGGGAYQLARRGWYEILPGKTAVFFYLAERNPSGGWKQPEHKDWINIPDSDEKAFTQISVKGNASNQTQPDNGQYAVFMHKKISGKKYAYVFYGTFNRIPNDDGVTVLFKRKSAALNPAQWQTL